MGLWLQAVSRDVWILTPPRGRRAGLWLQAFSRDGWIPQRERRAGLWLQAMESAFVFWKGGLVCFPPLAELLHRPGGLLGLVCLNCK